MPQFKVTDPASGKSLMLTGDSPPSEAELQQVFAGTNSGGASSVAPPVNPSVPTAAIGHPSLAQRFILAAKPSIPNLDPLFTPADSRNLLFRHVDQSPTTKLGALATLGQNLVNSVASPGGMALATLGPVGEEANPASRVALWKALGVLFAPQAGTMIGHGAEQLTRPGATGAERVLGGGELAQGSFMGLGSVAPHIPATPQLHGPFIDQQQRLAAMSDYGRRVYAAANPDLSRSPSPAPQPPVASTPIVAPKEPIASNPATSATTTVNSNIGMLDPEFRHNVAGAMQVVTTHEGLGNLDNVQASAARGLIKSIALKANTGVDMSDDLQAARDRINDVGLYNKSQQQFRAAVSANNESLLQTAWKKNEELKNKYGGMPPTIEGVKQPNETAIQPTQQQETGRSEATQVAQRATRSTQREAQGQVPADAGQGLGQPRQGDQHGDAGLLASRPVQGLNPTYPLSTSVHEGKMVDAKGLTVDPKTHKTTGESGFLLLPKDIVPKMGFAKDFKVQGEMLFNRLRNLLGADSGAWQALQGAGVGQFLKEKRTPEELKQWAEENAPKVEVRKFGTLNQAPETKAFNEMTHNWYDNLKTEDKSRIDRYLSDQGNDMLLDTLKPEDRLKAVKYKDLKIADRSKQLIEQNSQSHWSSIAPKSEKDMPGYVEIAVVKPVAQTKRYADMPNDKQMVDHPQFPSSHNFPPNTLGFVRGYMENVGGKKVFHVIEVQSDWAQHVREQEKSLSTQAPDAARFQREHLYTTKTDPLLPHYERLALKAAIDHARSEGADAIAISDAETAMMTEGHDRGLAPEWFETKEEALKQFPHGVINSSKEGGYWVERGTPSQEPGMKLHYDQTLPKIAGELTGSKGERVGFGEHKMAVEYEHSSPDGSAQGGKTTPRPDLIFRNPDGTPKTDVSARMYEIGKKNPTPEFTLFGKDKGEAGFVINVAPEIMDAIKRGANEVKALFSGENTTGFINQLRGKDLPHTSAVNKDVANKLYMYAQSTAVADVLSKTDPTEVLGAHYNDPAFDKKLGKTLVEYNLRATGNTSIGKSWGWKDETEYQKALNDPDVQAAIQRHADVILKDAEQRHEALGGKKVELQDLRMFVNLKFVPKDESLSGGPTGNLKATLERNTRFGQQRKGTAEEYETSYRKLAERMVKGNYTEYNRQQLNEEYVKQGLGVEISPGDAIPKDHVEIPLKVQRAVLIPEGDSPTITVNQNKSLYIRKDLAPEYLQAFNAYNKLDLGKLRKIADIMTRIQVSLCVDAIQHTINMTSAVDGAVRGAIGKNIIGAKELDTVSQLAKNAIHSVQDTPVFQKLLSEMAKEHGIAREEGTYHGLFGGQSWGGKAIRLVDQAGRVTLYQIAKDLADRGLIKNDPAEIRRFVNTQLGQYNPRLMSTFQAIVKSTLSPFIVAGKTFNRLAASRLLLSPQVKAANPKAWAEMRLRQALYVTSALVIVPAVANYAINGNALPADTKLGEINLGNGKNFDMAKWTLIRRGLRITGAQAALDQQIAPRLRGEQPAALGQTAKQGLMDVARGVGSPYAGPVPNAVATALMGKTALGYEARQPGEQFPYVKAAVRQLNPALGAGMTDQPVGESYKKRGMQLLGVSETKEGGVVNNLRRQYLYKIGKASDATFPPSEYDPLRQALIRGDEAGAKEAYQELYTEKLAQHKNDPNPEREAKMDFQKYFERYAKAHGNANKDDEAAFVKTLTPHQKDLYDKAQQQQQAAAELFFNKVQGKLAKKGQGGFHF